MALRLAPDFVRALVNLADFYRIAHRDGEGEPLLRRAKRLAPAAAEPAHALGLLLIRRGRRDEALPWLEKSAALAPQNRRYAYVLAVARQAASLGRTEGPAATSAERR
jgi:tetratricopeptide (TPR) repeat protein